MIAKAEDILWTAQRNFAEVAILFPQSATYWDLLGMKTGAIIKDATNHNLESACPEHNLCVPLFAGRTLDPTDQYTGSLHRCGKRT